MISSWADCRSAHGQLEVVVSSLQNQRSEDGELPVVWWAGPWKGLYQCINLLTDQLVDSSPAWTALAGASQRTAAGNSITFGAPDENLARTDQCSDDMPPLS